MNLIAAYLSAEDTVSETESFWTILPSLIKEITKFYEINPQGATFVCTILLVIVAYLCVKLIINSLDRKSKNTLNPSENPQPSHNSFSILCLPAHIVFTFLTLLEPVCDPGKNKIIKNRLKVLSDPTQRKVISIFTYLVSGFVTYFHFYFSQEFNWSLLTSAIVSWVLATVFLCFMCVHNPKKKEEEKK